MICSISRPLWLHSAAKRLETGRRCGNTVGTDSRAARTTIAASGPNIRRAAECPRAGALLAELAEAPCRVRAAADDRPLALYGAGNLGRLARDYLKAVHRDFDVAVDRAAGRLAADPEWAGVRMMAPEAVPGDVKRTVRLAVSVVTTPYAPLEKTLLADGFDDVVPVLRFGGALSPPAPIVERLVRRAPHHRGSRQYGCGAGRLGDDVSRAHHLQFLAWRRLREEWTFAGAPVANDNRFFIQEVRSVLRDDEVFVDGGAHHGEVSEAFAAVVGGFRQIVAIEPDPASSRAARPEIERPVRRPRAGRRVRLCVVGYGRRGALPRRTRLCVATVGDRWHMRHAPPPRRPRSQADRHQTASGRRRAAGAQRRARGIASSTADRARDCLPQCRRHMAHCAVAHGDAAGLPDAVSNAFVVRHRRGDLRYPERTHEARMRRYVTDGRSHRRAG